MVFVRRRAARHHGAGRHAARPVAAEQRDDLSRPRVGPGARCDERASARPGAACGRAGACGRSRPADFAVCRRHAARRSAARPSLAIARAARVRVDGRDGRAGGGHRGLGAAAVAGGGDPAWRHPCTDRPRARNRRAIGARLEARPPGLQPRRRRRAQRRHRVSVRDAGSWTARHSRAGSRSRPLVEHRPVVGHGGRRCARCRARCRGRAARRPPAQPPRRGDRTG
jgi:hypothetical protein